MLKRSKQAERRPAGKGVLTALARDLRGNTSIITALAMVPLLGLVGGGVDTARGYAVKSRLQHACDAGALAVRRVMSGTVPTASNINEGNKFFDFNFEDQTFGIPDSKVTRTFSAGPTSGSVKGVASAEMDVSIMRIFGMTDIDIAVNCEATVSVPNTDIMFVLDVTGSMASVPSGDTVSKLAGLKLAAKDFFDELGAGTGGGTAGRVRYGFVPYSGNVNVGEILTDLDEGYLLGENPGDTATYATRTPVTGLEWYIAATSAQSTHSYGTPTATTPSMGSYTSFGTSGSTTVAGTSYLNRVTPITSAACSARAVPPTQNVGGTITGPTFSSSTTPTYPTTTKTNYYNTTQPFTRTEYRYSYSSTSGGRCDLQRRTGPYTQTTASTTTQTVTWAQRTVLTGWTYGEAALDVHTVVSTGSVASPNYWTGFFAAGQSNSTSSGTPTATSTWQGCIEEPMGVNTITSSYVGLSTPSTAYDMQIDMKPNTAATKWRPFVRGFQNILYSNGSTESRATASGDTGACPSPASPLQSYNGRESEFDAYVDGLTAQGFTYHDIGMIWGARLLSPDGIMSGGNADSTAPGGFQISRHLVFMTDGSMSTSSTNNAAWGINAVQGREGVTGSTTTTLTSNHIKRMEIICEASKAKGFTIWVVGFGISSMPTSLANCATDADHVALASDSTALRAKFSAIAETIGGLRLSE